MSTEEKTVEAARVRAHQMLTSAVIAGSAASAMVQRGECPKSIDDFEQMLCIQVAHRLESLIREGNSFNGSIYILESEGWETKLSRVMRPSMEVGK